MNGLEEAGRFRRGRGAREYKLYLNGKQLSYKQSILAKCYECMGYYADGTMDCRIYRCPLYSYMPYNPNRIKRRRL